MILEVLKMRPDIKRVEVLMNLDTVAIQKLFLENNLSGNIEELCFKKFMWYDERAEAMAQFMIKNTTLRRLEILTTSDLNKGLMCIFEALIYNKSITEYKIAINTIGHDTILFLNRLVTDNKLIKSLDLT